MNWPECSIAGIIRPCRFGIGSAALLLGSFCGQAQTTNTLPRYYYAIEDIATGDVIRRGTTGASGISQGGLILAPNIQYRAWMFQGDTGLVGYQDFTTPGAGGQFTIPPVRFGLAFTPDSDADGLSDDAEYVLGTNPNNPDSDGDGIPDGAALRLGIDPGLLSRTRIVGTADTDGSAVDVCAINDIAIVADSAAGVTVFNVFNRMAPIRIAQVNTPGTASAVICSGNLIAVADGPAGLAIIDISDPPAARIVRQTGTNDLGGNARCVTAISDLAFVGTDSGWLNMVELGSGLVLDQLNLGGAIEDVAVESDTLYAFVSGQLKSIRVLRGPLQVLSSVAASGSLPAPRGRIFVGGGLAYLTFANGYTAFEVTNPGVPVRLVEFRDQIIFNFRHIVSDGSRHLLSPGGTATPGLNRYLLTNINAAARYELTIEAPGTPSSVALYNGLAYMAAGPNGLHVINYKEVDTGRQPPVGQLLVSVTNGTMVEGQRIVLRADVRDDVQLRNVQFFVNGSRYLVDGNFPFEVGWRAPAGSRGTTVNFTAVALDTGGNETNLNSVALNILPDTVPPGITISGPTNNTEFVVGDDIRISAGLFDANGIDSSTVEIFVDGVKVTVVRVAAGQWLIRTPPTLGSHTFIFRVRDYAGNVAESGPIQFIVVREAISRELTLTVLERAPGSPEAISRELTLTVLDRPPESQQAVSRELTVTVVDRSPASQEAVSRELTVTVLDRPPQSQQAVSRELTVTVADRSPVSQEAISRELTVTVFGRSSASLESISRELTVTVLDRPPGVLEAISRELTVTNEVTAPSGGGR